MILRRGKVTTAWVARYRNVRARRIYSGSPPGGGFGVSKNVHGVRSVSNHRSILACARTAPVSARPPAIAANGQSTSHTTPSRIIVGGQRMMATGTSSTSRGAKNMHGPRSRITVGRAWNRASPNIGTMRNSIIAGFICLSAVAACARSVSLQPTYPLNAAVVDTVQSTVTLPVHHGRAGNRVVWYIVTESSDLADARRRGVTYAPRLAALATHIGTQPATEPNGELRYAAGVDFTPERIVRAAPDSGFPPVTAQPGSIGEPGYSPFVRLASGVVLNAPIIADEHRTMDRVVSLDVGRGRVTMRITRGYALARDAWYISTEASDPMVAALEGATYASDLATIPTPASAGIGSARLGLLAVANGETDPTSFDRQGMRSALIGGLSPLNVMQGAPDPAGADPSYSPVWDLHLVMWTPAAISQNQRVKIITWAEAAAYAERGFLVSAMPGTANAALNGLTSTGIVVNCPVVATFDRGIQ